MSKQKEKAAASHKLLTVIGIILCVILIPILIINITLIVKSYTSEDVPSVGGRLPLIVLTDSMYPQIQSGDLVICRTTEPEAIETGDVIAFFDPAGNGTTIVTHRVVEVVEENGAKMFRTRGDNNNTEDRLLVEGEDIVGTYRSRIPGAGSIALFMQTTTGLIVCVVMPILLIVGYDIIRRRIYEKNKKEDTDALLAELAALRAEKAEKEKAAAQADEN